MKTDEKKTREHNLILLARICITTNGFRVYNEYDDSVLFFRSCSLRETMIGREATGNVWKKPCKMQMQMTWDVKHIMALSAGGHSQCNFKCNDSLGSLIETEVEMTSACSFQF